MTLSFSEQAVEVLERSLDAARRLNPDARIRLRLDAAGTLRADLVADAERGDEEIRAGNASVLAAQGLRGLVDVEQPHDRLVLRER